MSKFWSDTIHRLTPYVPGEQPKITGLIKLNTNECPYGPSPKALAAIQSEVDDSLKLYPDPNAERLTQCIANYYSTKFDIALTPENIFVGNGSDEILAHTFHGLLAHDKPVLFPDISYSFYPVYCNLYEIEPQMIPLTAEMAIDVEDFSVPNGGIIIPNPNAPTGIALPLKDIETLLKNNPNSVVVIDEAYIDFGGDSAIPLIEKYENLLVVQTLSKSRSLAGLRVGFALGHKQLIEGLMRVKNSFNSYPLARTAISGAVAAIEDQNYFEQICNQVIATRETLKQALSALNFEVLPSSANFLFVKHNIFPAIDIMQKLRNQKIIVRHFKDARIENYLRITVGTDKECENLVAALKQILQ